MKNASKPITNTVFKAAPLEKQNAASAFIGDGKVLGESTIQTHRITKHACTDFC